MHLWDITDSIARSGHFGRMRPLHTVNVARVILVSTYLAVSLAFARGRDWPELMEHGVLVFQTLMAMVVLALSARSWAWEIRLAGIANALDWLCFGALLLATGAADSPYFSCFIFLLMESAIVLPSRTLALRSLLFASGFLVIVGLNLSLTTGIKELDERIWLRFVHLLLGGWLIAPLFGPERGALLDRVVRERLKGLGDPAADPAEQLLQTGCAVGGCDAGMIIWRDARSHEVIVRQLGGVAPDAGVRAADIPDLWGSGHAWHGRRAGATIRLSDRARPQVTRLTRGGEEWLKLLDASEVLTLSADTSRFSVVLALVPDHPAHEDVLAISARAFDDTIGRIARTAAVEDAAALAAGRERERLHRNLHDSVLQGLASIRYALAPHVVEQGPGGPLQRIDTIARDQAAELRRILEPEAVQAPPGSVLETLRDAARAMELQWQISCEVEGEEDEDCRDAAIAREIGFAAREITANAVRHAGATRIVWTVKGTKALVTISARDDGRPTLARMSAGETAQPLSLTGRIAVLGGELSIMPDSSGTTLQMTLPCRCA